MGRLLLTCVFLLPLISAATCAWSLFSGELKLEKPIRPARVYASAPSGLHVTNVRVFSDNWYTNYDIRNKTYNATYLQHHVPRYYLYQAGITDHKYFTIDEYSGNITTNRYIDRLEGEEYRVQLVALIGGRSIDQELPIVVTKFNRYAPRLSLDQYTLEVIVTAARGTTLLTLEAFDEDEEEYNQRLQFFLTDDNNRHNINFFLETPTWSPLDIDPHSGELKVRYPLDMSKSPLRLLVGVSDWGSPQRYVVANLTVYIREMSEPRNVTVGNTTESSVNVCWYAPSHGAPEGYVLTYTPTVLHRRIYEQRAVNFTLDELNVLVEKAALNISHWYGYGPSFWPIGWHGGLYNQSSLQYGTSYWSTMRQKELYNTTLRHQYNQTYTPGTTYGATYGSYPRNTSGIPPIQPFGPGYQYGRNRPYLLGQRYGPNQYYGSGLYHGPAYRYVPGQRYGPGQRYYGPGQRYYGPGQRYGPGLYYGQRQRYDPGYRYGPGNYYGPGQHYDPSHRYRHGQHYGPGGRYGPSQRYGSRYQNDPSYRYGRYPYYGPGFYYRNRTGTNYRQTVDYNPSYRYNPNYKYTSAYRHHPAVSDRDYVDEYGNFTEFLEPEELYTAIDYTGSLQRTTSNFTRITSFGPPYKDTHRGYPIEMAGNFTGPMGVGPIYSSAPGNRLLFDRRIPPPPQESITNLTGTQQTVDKAFLPRDFEGTSTDFKEYDKYNDTYTHPQGARPVYPARPGYPTRDYDSREYEYNKTGWEQYDDKEKGMLDEDGYLPVGFDSRRYPWGTFNRTHPQSLGSRYTPTLENMGFRSGKKNITHPQRVGVMPVHKPPEDEDEDKIYEIGNYNLTHSRRFGQTYRPTYTGKGSQRGFLNLTHTNGFRLMPIVSYWDYEDNAFNMTLEELNAKLEKGSLNLTVDQVNITAQLLQSHNHSLSGKGMVAEGVVEMHRYCASIGGLAKWTEYVVGVRGWRGDQISLPATPGIASTTNNFCANGTCGHGNCTLHIESPGYTCYCHPGYYGQNCQYHNPCLPVNPCLHFGRCVNISHGTFRCECPPGFYGPNCTLVDPCSAVSISPCFNGGTCISEETKEYKCLCPKGFFGETCEGYDPCSTNPCYYGAWCTNITNTEFKCHCSLGYSGVLCEVDIDECGSSPCLNGATCIDGVGSFTCNCIPGYTGELCNVEIDECSPNPCQRGTCTDLLNGFICDCPKGWGGKTCDEDLDECASSPCLNGATCTDDVASFLCNCTLGYSGPNCAIPESCPIQTTILSTGEFQWPATRHGEVAILACPYGITTAAAAKQHKEESATEIPSTTEASMTVTGFGKSLIQRKPLSYEGNDFIYDTAEEEGLLTSASPPTTISSINEGDEMHILTTQIPSTTQSRLYTNDYLNVPTTVHPFQSSLQTSPDHSHNHAHTSPSIRPKHHIHNPTTDKPEHLAHISSVHKHHVDSSSSVSKPRHHTNNPFTVKPQHFAHNPINDQPQHGVHRASPHITRHHRPTHFLSSDRPRHRTHNPSLHKPRHHAHSPPSALPPIEGGYTTHAEWEGGMIHINRKTRNAGLPTRNEPTEASDNPRTSEREENLGARRRFISSRIRGVSRKIRPHRRRQQAQSESSRGEEEERHLQNENHEHKLSGSQIMQGSNPEMHTQPITGENPSDLTHTGDIKPVAEPRIGDILRKKEVRGDFTGSFEEPLVGQRSSPLHTQSDVYNQPRLEDGKSSSEVVETDSQELIRVGLGLMNFDESSTSAEHSHTRKNRLKTDSIVRPSFKVQKLNGMAIRKCVLLPNGLVAWEAPNTSICRSKATLTAENTSKNLAKLTSSPSTINAQMFARAAKQLTEVLEHALLDSTVASSMISVISNMMEVNDSVLASNEQGNATSQLVNTIDAFTRNVPLEVGESVAYRSNNLVVEAKLMKASENYSVTFRPKNSNSIEIKPTVSQAEEEASSSDHIPQKEPFLKLPSQVLSVAESENVRLEFASYGNDKFFRGGRSVGMPVLSAKVTDTDISNLSEPVVYYIPTSASTDVFQPNCVYWDDQARDWLSDGIKTLITDGVITCEANHLTAFSVLLDPVPAHLGGHEGALSIITYVGLALSTLGLIITVATYTIFRTLNRDRSGKIVMNLSLALLLLNLVFLVATQIEPPSVLCTVFAAALHYLVISAFAWMLVEGANMYQLLITVFASAETHFMAKRVAAAWGIPILTVIVALAVDRNVYGDEERNFCVINPNNNPIVYYSTYMGPICCVLAVNCVVFVMVTRVLCQRRPRSNTQSPTGSPQKESPVTLAQVRGAVTVVALLGVTWVAGAFSVGMARLPLQYLFCFTTPLQGLIIFIVRVAQHPEARASWLTLLKTGTLRRRPPTHTHSTHSSGHTHSTSSSFQTPRTNHSSSRTRSTRASPATSLKTPSSIQTNGSLKQRKIENGTIKKDISGHEKIAENDKSDSKMGSVFSRLAKRISLSSSDPCPKDILVEDEKSKVLKSTHEVFLDNKVNVSSSPNYPLHTTKQETFIRTFTQESFSQSNGNGTLHRPQSLVLLRSDNREGMSHIPPTSFAEKYFATEIPAFPYNVPPHALLDAGIPASMIPRRSLGSLVLLTDAKEGDDSSWHFVRPPPDGHSDPVLDREAVQDDQESSSSNERETRSTSDVKVLSSSETSNSSGCIVLAGQRIMADNSPVIFSGQNPKHSSSSALTRAKSELHMSSPQIDPSDLKRSSSVFTLGEWEDPRSSQA